ncbi:nucleotide-diphospho-sugar transferase [Dendrothele bispora CBS 962.96]|uniref:Nucleotide-diphospho-sugar transferase n=1 Tax=Dendrothele bispora (strain CBS 962.96) TaxID=1314807 RepID=A0A4S8MYM5_DENBC|nr:nucleotide-diphospho-sugar transferase [Dendrothele bispora CBS 962.96]
MAASRARLYLFFGLFVFALILFYPTGKVVTRTYREYTAYSNTGNRPNGVIFMLMPPSRVHQAQLALLNVENRFNRRLQYPYVLFMVEDEINQVSDEDKEKINWITQGRATFAAVPYESWNVPDFYDKSKVEESLHTIGFSLGYRAMCRFYSGLFWRHPALAQYDWLWRLDTDIEFHCDVPYDPIQRLIDANALVGFVQINPDADFVQPTLSGNVSQFLAQNAHLLPSHANHGFVWNGREGIEKALKGEAGNHEWSRMTFYNNFEISHKSVWENELYKKFFDFLDRAGGFFYERWSDAPIHAFGLAMSLRKEQILQFTDLGYQHQGWAYECPKLDRCTCKYDEEPARGFYDNAPA